MFTDNHINYFAFNKVYVGQFMKHTRIDREKEMKNFQIHPEKNLCESVHNMHNCLKSL